MFIMWKNRHAAIEISDFPVFIFEGKFRVISTQSAGKMGNWIWGINISRRIKAGKKAGNKYNAFNHIDWRSILKWIGGIRCSDFTKSSKPCHTALPKAHNRIDIGVWDSWHHLYTFIGDVSARPPPGEKGWLIGWWEHDKYRWSLALRCLWFWFWPKWVQTNSV